MLLVAVPSVREFCSILSQRALTTLEDVHLELGEALGIGRKGQVNDTAALTDVLRQFRNALADYVRVMLGGVDRRDPASIARVEVALEPIARFKKMVAANRPAANGNGSQPAVEPVPPPTSLAPSTP